MQETCNENAINLTSLERKLCTRAKMLANKRKFGKTKRVNECNDAKQTRLAKKRECDKLQRAIESINEKKVRLAKKAELARLHRAQETNDKQRRLAKRREAYKNRISSLSNQKESNVQENQSASTCLTTHSNVTQDIGKTVYLSEFDALRNGALHEQCWAKCSMKEFHKSMQYVIFQCTICKEA